MADDTISIFEPAQKNSGIIEGPFLERRKYKNVDGQESFETTSIEAPNVDPTYQRWSQMQIINELKEELLYVTEEPLEGIGAAQQIRSQNIELPDG